MKGLKIALYCSDCNIELASTEKGIACSECGGYLSDEEMESAN